MYDILIVEDEAPIANLIRMSLTQAGYRCTIASDGDEGADWVERRRFDLILLDVMLPHTSGFELMEYIRQYDTPVIFLTARTEVRDRVKGLRLGAEDYIIKPFDVAELQARVEVVLRRYHKGGGKVTVGDITADLDSRIVTRGGHPVDLTPKEFDILRLFLPGTKIWPSSGRPSMSGCGASRLWATPAPWTCTCSACATSWAGKSGSPPYTRWATAMRRTSHEVRR